MTRLLGITLALIILALLALAPGLPGQDLPRTVERVFLTRAEAISDVLGGAEVVESCTLVLTDDEKSRVKKRLRRPLFEKRLVIYRVWSEATKKELRGYAVITEEIGKYQPITFAVGLTAKPAVKRVSVMAYRESHGEEVKRRRFLRQFTGKTTDDAVRVNRDVINISGATLSARALSRGTKKVLHAVDELLIGEHRRKKVEWKAVTLEKKTSALPGGRTSRVRVVMGTTLRIEAHGSPTSARARVEAAIEAAFEDTETLEELLSTYRPESELSRVNRDAFDAAVAVSPATIECIARALEHARKSDGAFDPTQQDHGHRSVVVDREASTVRFLREDLSLDLGGIAKGFALDRAAAILQSHGVNRALLDFGGQILAMDPPPGERAWLVAVRDPRAPDAFLGGFAVCRASVSTSGAYERGPHVVDPRTGAPTRHLSATVCLPSATDADALSTVLNVTGPRGVEALAPWMEKGSGVVVESGADGEASATTLTVFRGSSGSEFTVIPAARRGPVRAR